MGFACQTGFTLVQVCLFIMNFQPINHVMSFEMAQRFHV